VLNAATELRLQRSRQKRVLNASTELRLQSP
jgi:hypothetical protein